MKNSKQLMFLNLILLQLFLSCFIALSYAHLRTCNWEFSYIIIFAVVVLIGVLCIWTMKEILQLVREEHEAEIAATRLEESKALIKTLKSRQHDFANHLQTIYGMIYLGKVDRVKEYIKNISADLHMVDRLTGLKYPELAALIGKKMTTSYTVKLDIAIETDLAHLKVPADKMVSIVGNLLDNAIQEEEKQDSPNNVSLRIIEQDGEYIFEVHNSGYIPPNLHEKIFEAGFTTKAEAGGSGMGLYIVKTMVSQCGGTLSFETKQNEGTTFTVRLPMDTTGKNEKIKKKLFEGSDKQRVHGHGTSI